MLGVYFPSLSMAKILLADKNQVMVGFSVVEMLQMKHQ